MDEIAKQIEELQNVFDGMLESIRGDAPEPTPEQVLVFNKVITKISDDIYKKVSKRVRKFVKKLSKLEKDKNNVC